MNIPHYTTSIRRIDKVIKTYNKTFFELLQLPIPDLINIVTGNTLIGPLLLDKITFIRQLDLRIGDNVRLDKNKNNIYERALNYRLRTLISLLNPDQSCKFLLKVNQDELFLSKIANKIINNKDSTVIHYLSILTSIIYNNRLNSSDFAIGCKTRLQVLEDSFIIKINEIINTNTGINSIDLTYCLLLFSVYHGQYKSNLSNKVDKLSLLDDLISKDNNKLISDDIITFDNSIDINSHRPDICIIRSVIETISEKLLLVDDYNPEIISLMLESIANIYSVGEKSLSNLNNLLQKLLHMPLEKYLIGDGKLSDHDGLKSSSILSRVLYGVYKTDNFSSPIFSRIINSLIDGGLGDIKFNNPLELFRASFPLIVSNQISNKDIFRWLLNETVRLSDLAIKYPSQFLFVLTGLSLSPNLSLSEVEKTKGSSISFDKSVYERAEADLRLLETGQLSFSSDILSMRHLFSLAESLIPNLNNDEFVQLLHCFCSTKLHHSRLVKMRIYSECLRRLPMLPVESLSQILRLSIWLLKLKSEETIRLAYAVSDRLLGELVSSGVSSFVIIDCLILLDKCNIYSNELAVASCMAFAKRSYEDLNCLNFSNTSYLLHYLSSSSISISIKTSGEIKETELEITRDFLFTKSIHILKNTLDSTTSCNNVTTDTIDTPSNVITLDSVIKILHSAHLRGEVTRYSSLVDLSVGLVNYNCVSNATGDSISECVRLLSAMSGKEYKYIFSNGVYEILKSN